MRRGAWSIPQTFALGTLLLVLSAAVALLSVQVRGRRAVDAVTPVLRRTATVSRHTPWSPPGVSDVLREDNGFTWQLAHSAWARSMPETLQRELRAAHEHGTAPSAQTSAWLASHQADLDAYALAAEARSAHETLSVAQGYESPTPSYISILRAQQALVAQVVLLGPERCLTAAARAARLGQQLVPGSTAVGAMIATVMVHRAVGAALVCAPGASPAARQDAAPRWELLARHPPPWNDTLGNEALLILGSIHQALTQLPTLPRRLDDGVHGFHRMRVVAFLDRWLQPPGPWERFAARGEAHSQVEAFERFTSEVAGLPPPYDAAALSLETFRERMQGVEGEVRRFVLLLQFLVARDQGAASADAPPARLTDPAFADPLTGRAFRWSRVGDRVRLQSEHRPTRTLRELLSTELQLPP